MLTWNVERSRATAGALEIADQVAADVIFLQEASIGQSWHGPICSEQVQGRAWGSAVLVRDGSLEPIAIHGYSGWVTGACWRPSQRTSQRLSTFFDSLADSQQRRTARRVRGRVVRDCVDETPSRPSAAPDPSLEQGSCHSLPLRRFPAPWHGRHIGSMRVLSSGYITRQSDHSPIVLWSRVARAG